MQAAKNIVVFFLSVSLLIATTGFSLHTHYCLGRVQGMAINQKAGTCAGEEGMKMPCCKDVSETLKVSEVTLSGFDFDAQPDLYVLHLIPFTYQSTTNHSFALHSSLFFYRPPPLVKQDIPVFIQSFLI